MKLESLSWPVRWESSLLIFVGLICNYAMRLNISIAIIKVDTESGKKSDLKKLPPDEREQDDPTLASAQLFPNILEHRGPGSRLVRFLLRLHRLPGSSPSLP